MIKIETVGPETWRVTVEGNSTTTHEVKISEAYYKKLTGGKVSTETLLEKSFEFLLERESNNSILSAFDLPVIARYFPEYESTIIERLG